MTPKIPKDLTCLDGCHLPTNVNRGGSARFQTDCGEESEGYFNCYLNNRKRNSRLARPRRKVSGFWLQRWDIVFRMIATREPRQIARGFAILWRTRTETSSLTFATLLLASGCHLKRLSINFVAVMMRGFSSSTKGFHALRYLWKPGTFAMQIVDSVSFLQLLESLNQLVQIKRGEP